MARAKKMPYKRRKARAGAKTRVPRTFARADAVPDRIVKTHTSSITYKVEPVANQSGYTQDSNCVMIVKMNSGHQPFKTGSVLRTGGWYPVYNSAASPEDDNIAYLNNYLASSGANPVSSGTAYQEAAVIGAKLSVSIRGKPLSNRSDYSDCLVGLLIRDTPVGTDFYLPTSGKYCGFNEQLSWQHCKTGETKQHVGGQPRGCYLTQGYSQKKALGLNKSDSLAQSEECHFSSSTDPSEVHYAIITIQPKGCNSQSGTIFDLDADHFVDIKLEQSIMYWKPNMLKNQPITETIVDPDVVGEALRASAEGWARAAMAQQALK